MEKQLTDEQKKKLRKLEWKILKRSALGTFKNFCLFAISSAIIIFINLFFVHSDSFVLIGSVISYFFIMRSWIRQLSEDRKKIVEELKKILEE